MIVEAIALNKKNRNVKESKAAAAPVKTGRQIGKFFLHLFLLAFPLFLTELLCYFLMHPTELWALAFGGFWALLLAAVVLLLPQLPGRILYGLVFYATFIWSIMQAGYYQVFGKLMWISTLSYAGEAAGFVDDVLGSFPPLWWISLFGMILLGALLLGFVAYGLSIYFYIYAQRDLGAAKTSTYYAVAPFVGAGLSLLIFWELPSVSYLVALVIMIAGTWLATVDGVTE